ncbi:transporter substrate-binding domain-containing protein [uncultured Enterovirga sp.]|uniref:transporter substrate-binding domain-containing protein n=1 Tax=uncultured Enterovirga sp. TaxID=2026352 RepID=UPI0035C951E9
MTSSSNVMCAIVAVGLAMGAAVTASAKDYKKITIGTEGAYPPYNLTEPNGKLAGFETDLLADLCPRMKVECVQVQQDWGGTIPALNAGKFDAIMSGMKITAKRLEVIAFSREYADSPQGLLVQASSPLAKLPGTGSVVNITKDEAKADESIAAMREMLRGKTIAVQVATNKVDFLKKYFGDVAKIQEYNLSDQMDLDLMSGRVDAVFNEIPYFDKTMKKPGAKDLQLAGTQWRGGVLGAGVAVGLRKSDPELKAMFDAAIEAATADGSLKRIADKWFSIDVRPTL